MSESRRSTLWAFVPDLVEAGAYTLDSDEARHVTARRLRVGDALVLFDGAGRRAAAQVEAIRKKSVEVVAEVVEVEPEKAAGHVLATAIPKGDRLSTMLQMLTQLGVSTWQPLVLQDSAIRDLDPDAKRLRRILVESAKVARRSWLLRVAPPCELGAVLDGHMGSVAGPGPIYFGDREGQASGLASGAGLIVIGPEAGFTGEEREILLRVGALPCAFSAHNLRIEVAAVGAAVALNLAAADVGLAGQAGRTS